MSDQIKMFGEQGKSQGLPPELLHYAPALFNETQSRDLTEHFIATVPWEQRTITMYGKKVVTPRLTAWYGDEHKGYAYSGTRFNPMPWTQELRFIKEVADLVAGVTFNSVLLNYYRNGNDSVAWHSDNETELGKQPVIASVSFGQVRRFDIRHKADHARKYSINLENGSVLIMQGDLQQNWEHRIAKSVVPMAPRVNLTFRIIH